MSEHKHTDECWEPSSGCDMGRNPDFVVRSNPMTIPPLPPFPEKPNSTCDCDLCRARTMPYYRDLAAAWEARARLLHVLAEQAANNDATVHDANRVLRECGPLPPKE